MQKNYISLLFLLSFFTATHFNFSMHQLARPLVTQTSAAIAVIHPQIINSLKTYTTNVTKSKSASTVKNLNDQVTKKDLQDLKKELLDKLQELVDNQEKLSDTQERHTILLENIESHIDDIKTKILGELETRIDEIETKIDDLDLNELESRIDNLENKDE